MTLKPRSNRKDSSSRHRSIFETMSAFDRPIEADKVDLNLFSKTVLGTLMWILGGHHSKEQDEEEQPRRQAHNLLAAAVDDETSDRQPLRSSNTSLRKMPSKSVLKKSAPSMIGSEISEVGECLEALDGMLLDGGQTRPLKRCKKELSWSDESGQSLVEYIGEVSCFLALVFHSSICIQR